MPKWSLLGRKGKGMIQLGVDILSDISNYELIKSGLEPGQIAALNGVASKDLHVWSRFLQEPDIGRFPKSSFSENSAALCLNVQWSPKGIP